MKNSAHQVASCLLLFLSTLLMVLLTGCEWEDDETTTGVQVNDCRTFHNGAFAYCLPGSVINGRCIDHYCAHCDEQTGSDAGPANYAAEQLMTCAP